MRRLWHAAAILRFFLFCGIAVSVALQAEETASIADPSHPIQGSSFSANLDVSKAQTVQVELTKDIRAAKAKAGDVVSARTVTALILPGQVVIPEGAKVIGHVTRASGGADRGNSAIAIAFDHFEMKNRQVLAADFLIRSGAMYERPSRPAEAGDDITDPPGSPTSTTPNNPSKPSKMTLGGVSNSTEAQVEQAQSQSRSQQPPLKVQNADDNHGDMRAITKGTLIGMPGVALRLDEASGAATFESPNRKLELKSGLQLLVSVSATSEPSLGKAGPAQK